jgi:uncharacterized protein with FMN-binding domain
MRRAVPALIVTLAGLALLANFHTAAGSKRGIVALAPTTTTPAAGSSPPPSGTTTPTTTGTGGGVRQIDGQVEPTQFGDIQVRVILRNGRITDVQPLQMPFDHQRSLEISQAVAPLLHDEVLQAQSARIDLISGATYTSDAYAQSLQAALDQARA